MIQFITAYIENSIQSRAVILERELTAELQ